jgi:WD40 repeat protein
VQRAFPDGIAWIRIGREWAVYGVALTANGKRAASASIDKTLKVWDLESGGCIATFHADAGVFCCGFIGRTIVAGDGGGRVHFLRLEE